MRKGDGAVMEGLEMERKGIWSTHCSKSMSMIQEESLSTIFPFLLLRRKYVCQILWTLRIELAESAEKIEKEQIEKERACLASYNDIDLANTRRRVAKRNQTKTGKTEFSFGYGCTAT